MRSLLADCFSLLLLLDTRSRGTVRLLQVHGWHKRTRKFLLRDERMHLCLLRRPSFERIQMQKAVDKVNEGRTIGHFYLNVSETYWEKKR